MKVLIASANGYGNAGDDMCALASQHLVHSINKRHKIRVTAPPFYERLLSWSDAVILGGGGIIYDANQENMENYLQYLDYAIEHEKKAIGLGLGEQGIVTKAGERRYKSVFNKMDLLTMRSSLDKERLDKIGVKQAVATQDLAFSFDYTSYRAKAEQRHAHRKRFASKPKLGIVLSNQEHLVNDLKLAFSKQEKVNALHFKNALEDNLQHITEAFDVTVITQSHDDLGMAKSFKRRHNVRTFSYKHERDLHKLLTEYTKQDLILTQRFHGLVFSFMLGIPVIALGYHGQKQYKLLHDLRLTGKLIMYHQPKELEKLIHEISVSSRALDARAIRLADKHRAFLYKSAEQNRQLLEVVLAEE